MTQAPARSETANHSIEMRTANDDFFKADLLDWQREVFNFDPGCFTLRGPK